MVAGKSFGINTDFSAMTDDGKFEAAAAEAAEEPAPAEDTVSDTSQSTSSDDHDYRISMDNIDYLERGKDGYLTLRASCNLYDDYTRDPASSTDNFSYAVASDCTTIYYGDTIPDADSFINGIMEDWSFIQDAKNNKSVSVAECLKFASYLKNNFTQQEQENFCETVDYLGVFDKKAKYLRKNNVAVIVALSKCFFNRGSEGMARHAEFGADRF